MTGKKKDKEVASEKVLTHERFMRNTDAAIAKQRESDSSLNAFAIKYAEQLEGGDLKNMALPTDISGGELLGKLTETEKSLYSKMYKAKETLDSCYEEDVESLMKNKGKEKMRSIFNAVIDEDVEALQSAMTKQEEFSDEEHEALTKICKLQANFDFIRNLFFVVLKTRLNKFGRTLGIRSGWKVYDFGYEWMN